ncbi:MAG: ShlB/FhaC/HecB family hemolysin secretion/activation protein [Burkholderiales bacterium]
MSAGLYRHAAQGVLAAVVTMCIAAPTLAQTAPPIDSGAVLRELEKPRIDQPPRPAPAIPPAPAETEAAPGVRVTVREFAVSGATLLSKDAIDAALAPFIGQPLDLAGLRRAADAVSEAYRRAGRLARVTVPPQNIEDGRVRLDVTEAAFGQLTIDNASRLNAPLAERMLLVRQAAGAPLDARALESAMLVINDLPGVAAKALLSAGAAHGQTDVGLQLRDTGRVSLLATIDNHGSRYTGQARIGLQAALNEPLGLGDQMSAQLLHSDGLDYLRAGYSLAAGALGTRVALHASGLRYRLSGGTVDALDARGRAIGWGLGLTHPLLRGARANWRATVAFDQRQLVDEVLQVETANKRIDALTIGLNGDHIDDLGAGGLTWGGALLTLGRLDLGGNAAALAADRLSARTQGSYAKLNAFVARQQRVAPRVTVKGVLSGQIGSKNLDSSETFSLGGPSGLRAFAGGEARADQGWMLNLDARYAFAPQWSAGLLVDAGGVCVHRDPWSGAGASHGNCYALKDYGASLQWDAGRFSLRASVARQWGGNAGVNALGQDVEGRTRRYRAWAQLTAAF